MSDQPNILFLHSDEHSFRFLSSRSRENGGEPCRTPTLDSLAKRGTTFDVACCQMPLCTPSRIAMLTGRHPQNCGAWNNKSILRPGIPTFGSHLLAHGYATATIGKMHLGGSLQYAGFGARPYGDFGGPCAHQFDPLRIPSERKGETGMALRSRTLDAGLSEIPESFLQEQIVVRESLTYLREHRHANPNQPFLLYASFSRPHFPLTAPKRFFDRYYPKGVTPAPIGKTGDSADHPMTLGAIKGFRTDEIPEAEAMKARAAYFASVDFLDEILGDFLSLLDRDGLLEDTVIIYTSDHGELAGEHGLWWKNTWHEAAVRVPLIVSLPKFRNNDRCPAEIQIPVSLADLFPTICGLCNIDPPQALDGIDLSSLIQGKPCPALAERPGVITEALTPRWGPGTEFRAIRSERYKYIVFRNCDDLAFDLKEDPTEQHNIANIATGETASLLYQLRRAVIDQFDFDLVEKTRKKENAELQDTYLQRVRPQTPNQIQLGNGQLVEADTSLYIPEIVSNNLASDFDDYPIQT